MIRTVKIDLKEDDYFGSVNIVDGELDQFIIQRYRFKDRVHSDEDILDAVAQVIADETEVKVEQ